MRNQTQGLRSMLFVLAALSASDAAAVINAALPGMRDANLAAQTVTHDEEQMFLQARRALSREEFDQAAEMFRAFRAKYNAGRFVADSYYWEAFARYRQGNLPEALMLLDLAALHRRPTPTGRLYTDVRDLRLRIQRQQAEKGDPRAAADVLRESERVLRESEVAAVRHRIEAVRLEVEAARREAESEVMRLQGDSTLAAALEFHRMRADSMRADADSRAWIDLVSSVRGDLRGIDIESSRLVSGTGIPPQVPEVCEDASVQQEALIALLRLERGRMASIRSVLEREDECSVHLRHQAVNWLAREGTEEAEATLADVAANHPAAETRKWAVKGLAGFETPGSAEVLVSILRNSEDESIRSDAIAALGYNRSEEATEALAAFSSDIGEPEQLRQKAAAALGLRISAEPRLLMEVFDKVDSERIRISFLEVLGRRAQAGEESVASWLFEQALDSDLSLDVRKAALGAWSRGSAVEVDLQRLAESYDQFEEPELRERIFYALYLQARSDEDLAPMAVDRMVELVRVETDPEVKKRAVYWLGRTGSERAAEFLMELLREPPGGPSIPEA